MSYCRLLLAILVVGLAAELACGQDDAEQVRRQQLDARVQQYVQLLQPAMWQELDFIRQVCDLTPEQRPQIREAGDIAVKEAAKAILQPQPVRAGVRLSQPTLGAQTIRDHLHATLKKTLTSEQLERFEAEDAKRTETTKQTILLMVTAQLDSALYLSKEQREKITENLKTNWQRDWEQWITIHQYNGQYFPQVPDQHVVPYLNADQKLVWEGLQKVSINAWHNNGNRQPEDGWWNAKGSAVAKNTAKNAKGKAALLKPPKKTN
jgi:hypothetical protein